MTPAEGMYRGRRNTLRAPSRLPNRGVSFQELLIAIAILALAMVPSINMIFHFRSYTLHTEDVNLGLQLASEKMEEYKHMSFRELVQFDGNQENGPVAGQDNPLGYDYSSYLYAKYKRKVHIKTNYGGDKNKCLITVHVWWHDKLFDFNDGRYVRIASLKVNENFF